MASYVQFDDFSNVDSIHCRYLFYLHEELVYNLYSSNHCIFINEDIILSFLDCENLIFVHLYTVC